MLGAPRRGSRLASALRRDGLGAFAAFATAILVAKAGHHVGQRLDVIARPFAIDAYEKDANEKGPDGPAITVSFTFAVPGPIRSMLRAAAFERSMIRSRTNGPRSVMRTSTVLLLDKFFTRTQVPKGSVRCAAVHCSMSYISPFAARRP